MVQRTNFGVKFFIPQARTRVAALTTTKILQLIDWYLENASRHRDGNNARALKGLLSEIQLATGYSITIQPTKDAGSGTYVQNLVWVKGGSPPISTEAFVKRLQSSRKQQPQDLSPLEEEVNKDVPEASEDFSDPKGETFLPESPENPFRVSSIKVNFYTRKVHIAAEGVSKATGPELAKMVLEVASELMPPVIQRITVSDRVSPGHIDWVFQTSLLPSSIGGVDLDLHTDEEEVRKDLERFDRLRSLPFFRDAQGQPLELNINPQPNSITTYQDFLGVMSKYTTMLWGLADKASTLFQVAKNEFMSQRYPGMDADSVLRSSEKARGELREYVKERGEELLGPYANQVKKLLSKKKESLSDKDITELSFSDKFYKIDPETNERKLNLQDAIEITFKDTLSDPYTWVSGALSSKLENWVKGPAKPVVYMLVKIKDGDVCGEEGQEPGLLSGIGSTVCMKHKTYRDSSGYAVGPKRPLYLLYRNNVPMILMGPYVIGGQMHNLRNQVQMIPADHPVWEALVAGGLIRDYALGDNVKNLIQHVLKTDKASASILFKNYADDPGIAYAMLLSKQISEEEQEKCIAVIKEKSVKLYAKYCREIAKQGLLDDRELVALATESPEEAYTYAVMFLGGKPYPALERGVLQQAASGDLTFPLKYLTEVRKARWPELEKILLGQASSGNYSSAYKYVQILKLPEWPELEKVLVTKKNTSEAINYAITVARVPFSKNSPLLSMINSVLKSREAKKVLPDILRYVSTFNVAWPEAEAAILANRNPELIDQYYRDSGLQGSHWEPLEKTILATLSNPRLSVTTKDKFSRIIPGYLSSLVDKNTVDLEGASGSRWPKVEPLLAKTSPETMGRYLISVTPESLPQYEYIIAALTHLKAIYFNFKLPERLRKENPNLSPTEIKKIVDKRQQKAIQQAVSNPEFLKLIKTLGIPEGKLSKEFREALDAQGA